VEWPVGNEVAGWEWSGRLRWLFCGDRLEVADWKRPAAGSRLRRDCLELDVIGGGRIYIVEQ
jgi:hypothetical protein